MMHDCARGAQRQGVVIVCKAISENKEKRSGQEDKSD
jgi:hypothetical protein